MKTFTHRIWLPPILLAAVLFSGCYSVYSTLNAQDCETRDEWMDTYVEEPVFVPPVAFFVNPFQFAPCAPPVVYPVYDLWHRCWIPRSEFGVWLDGPDLTIGFEWGLDWRFGLWSSDWFPVSRWYSDHPRFGGPRHYSHPGYYSDRNRRWNVPRHERPPRRAPGRGRRDDDRNGRGGRPGWDDGRNGHNDRPGWDDGNRAGRDPAPPRERGSNGPGRDRDRNRPFNRPDSPRDRGSAGDVRRTPPAAPRNLADTIRRIVVAPETAGREAAEWNSGGRGNGPAAEPSVPDRRRIPRPEANPERRDGRNAPPQAEPRRAGGDLHRIVAGPDGTERNGARLDSDPEETVRPREQLDSDRRRIFRRDAGGDTKAEPGGWERTRSRNGNGREPLRTEAPSPERGAERMLKSIERFSGSRDADRDRRVEESPRKRETARASAEFMKRDSERPRPAFEKKESKDAGNRSQNRGGNGGARRGRR
jgi:hypothetical protein